MNLSTWLEQISKIHPKEMELGLERVKAVAERIGVKQPPCPVVIIGGTNGKGSTVRALEAIYGASSYKTGAFTTPTLFRHNEQVRINGKEVEDDDFCTAFKKIEEGRGHITLTPFEYHTLAAMLIFQSQPLDVWILEVGLGGRLDAVNIMDADVAIITSIGIDHTEWLGSTREMIASEKAGIFRKNRPAVCADKLPPSTLLEYAKKLEAPLYCLTKEFDVIEHHDSFEFQTLTCHLQALPKPNLYLPNVSAALMAIQLLQARLPVEEEAIRKSLINLSLPGRMQIVALPVMHIYDVSHNPDGVRLLAENLKKLPRVGKRYAVFSMLKDKDILSSIKAMDSIISTWFVAPLATERAASAETLIAAFHEAGIENVLHCQSMKEAYHKAKQLTKEGDCIIVFGSFHAVSEVQC